MGKTSRFDSINSTVAWKTTLIRKPRRFQIRELIQRMQRAVVTIAGLLHATHRQRNRGAAVTIDMDDSGSYCANHLNLLATLADFDLKGRMVVHGVSLQFIGYAVSPAIAAQLLDFGYDVINTTAAILFVAAALLLLPGVMAQHEGLRR